MAYATVDDLLERFDYRLIGDLVSDDNESVDESELSGNAKLQTALDDAEAEVNSSLLAGGRFTLTQLANVPAETANYLKRIVCCLAVAALHERRPEAVDKDRIERLTSKGMDAIKALREGKNILGLAEEIAAGRVDVGGPTLEVIQNRNDLTTRMGRMFPEPYTRLPRSRP